MNSQEPAAPDQLSGPTGAPSASHDHPSHTSELKRQVLSGGVYLAVRQGIGILVSAVGVLLLTREIGPENYGTYVAAIGVFTYVQQVCSWGISVSLVRNTDADNVELLFHQGFTLLLILGVGGTLLTLAVLPKLADWITVPGFRGVMLVLLPGLIPVLLSQVPLAALERRLDYRRVAMIELASQLTYYGVALPLAFRGWGVRAPMLGWWAQQAALVASLFLASRYRPKLVWHHRLAKSIVSYALGFASSMWLWQARTLLNPLIVGRYAGAASVGYVALALRITELLGFVKTATWRISISALSRIQERRDQLASAITQGISLQVLAYGPLLVLFATVAPLVLARFFGPRWVPVLYVFPPIAFAYLVNSIFGLHSSVLYVLRRNWDVAVFHLFYIVTFTSIAVLSVRTFGVVGFGYAEIAAIPTYSLLHWFTIRQIPRPSYGPALAWIAACAIPLFTARYVPWATVMLLMPLILPSRRREMRDVIAAMRRKVAYGT